MATNKASIFAAMSPENQKMALEAVGIQCDGDEYGENETLDSGSRVPVWSELEVSVPESKRAPIYDKSALFAAQKQVQQQAPRTNAYGMPEPGEDEASLLATGLV